MQRLKGKTAIVTGGGTGIGEAICKKFAMEGANVVVAGFPDDPVDDVAEWINNKGGSATEFKGNLSREEDASDCVQAAIEKWGKIDILINNAGVFPEVNTTDQFSTEAFDNMLLNNIRTAFLMTKFSLPYLKKSRGCIVSAGSEAGKQGIAQNAAYGGTKGFMHAFTQGIAVEQAQNGIRANCVSPGAIDTAWTHKETSGMDKEMEKSIISSTPLGRRGTPEEMANVYLFLASDEASFITGALVSADGGITISKGPVGDKVPEELKKPPKGTLDLHHSKEGATEIR